LNINEKNVLAALTAKILKLKHTIANTTMSPDNIFDFVDGDI
jgi:hypothetical protein